MHVYQTSLFDSLKIKTMLISCFCDFHLHQHNSNFVMKHNPIAQLFQGLNFAYKRNTREYRIKHVENMNFCIPKQTILKEIK